MKWLRSIIYLFAQALISFWLARMLNSGAQLIGPFILLFPLFVVSFFALAFSRLASKPEEGEESREIAERLSKLPHRLKKLPRVYLYSNERGWRPVNQARNQILINLAHWKDLSWEERDFLLARAIARLESDEKPKTRLIVMAVTILAGMAAALNLWSIIFSHFMMLCYGVAAFKGLKDREKTREFAADRRAIELTGDKEAALRFARTEHVRRPSAFWTLDERIDSIESVELGPSSPG